MNHSLFVYSIIILIFFVITATVGIAQDIEFVTKGGTTSNQTLVPSIFKERSKISNSEKQTKLAYCEKIPESPTRNRCFIDLAIASQDPELCDSGFYVSDSCYKDVAQQSCDIQICDRIKDTDDRKWCILQTTHVCFRGMTLEECLSLSDQYLIDGCLFKYFRETDKRTQDCFIADNQGTELCMGTSPLDTSICKEIEDFNIKNWCYLIGDSYFYIFSYLTISLLFSVLILILIFATLEKLFNRKLSRWIVFLIGFLFGTLIRVLPDLPPLESLLFHRTIIVGLTCPPNSSVCVSGDWISFPTPWGIFVMFLLFPLLYSVLAIIGHRIYLKIANMRKKYNNN